ncbi:MAG: polyprenyl synthetase family protein [Flavobacteriaceae bacterium]|tara:strand:+ start:2638 stop:3612 length:975 start_codon:yes stop_codon:yes gene_type:complete
MLSVEEYHNQFLDYLENYNPPNSPSNLYDPVSYILRLKGKRIRPILTLLTCDLFNNNFKDAFDAALAVEVFHNFSLVHDDIMDEAPLRRGNETVHKKWDLSTAILSGDVMLILAYQLFENYSGDMFVSLAKLFSKTAVEVCEGQQMDIDFSNKNDISSDKYLKMIEFKTAVLLGASMKMGAIVSKASLKEQNSIYEFGKNLGMAFQIQDDLLDTFGVEEKFGKKIGGDILENKKTLLFIRANQLLGDKDKLRLIELYSTKELDETSKINEVKNLYSKCGIPEIMSKEIKDFTMTAFQMLDNINISTEKKEFLIDFGNSLMKRNI